MTKRSRLLIVMMNVLMLFALVEIRQSSQMIFSELQELVKLGRIEKQALNQIKLDYLKSLNVVPIVARKKGFKPREIESGV